MAKEYKSVNEEQSKKPKRKIWIVIHVLSLIVLFIGSICLLKRMIPKRHNVSYDFTEEEMQYAKMNIGNRVDSANKALLYLVAKGYYNLDSDIKLECDDYDGYSTENYFFKPYYDGFEVWDYAISIKVSKHSNNVYMKSTVQATEVDAYNLDSLERDLKGKKACWSLKGGWKALKCGGIDETVWYPVNWREVDAERHEYRLCHITNTNMQGTYIYIIDAQTGEVYRQISTITD